MPRPPETMILAAVSSGRADFGVPGRRTSTCPVGAPRATASTAPSHRSRRRRRSRCAHGDDLDRVGRLHGRQRVAGVDRAHEGVGGLDADDVGDLRHVEQRGDARQDVLAEGGGRREDVRVARRADDERATFSASLVGHRRGFGDAAPCARRRSWRRPPRRHRSTWPGDEDVDVAADLRGGGDGVERWRA
jgi:hypothetical protein